MKGKKVWVVSCNSGVIGVYEDRINALQSAKEHEYAEYKGVEMQEMTIR